MASDDSYREKVRMNSPEFNRGQMGVDESREADKGSFLMSVEHDGQ